MWKSIRKGVESFFSHVLYAAGEGFHIKFWHDPWSSPTALKDLYLALFAIVVNKEAMISKMVDYALDGGATKLHFSTIVQPHKQSNYDPVQIKKKNLLLSFRQP